MTHRESVCVKSTTQSGGLLMVMTTHQPSAVQAPHSRRVPVSISLSAPGNEKDGERLEQVVGMLGVLKSFLVGLFVHNESTSHHNDLASLHLLILCHRATPRIE